MATTILWATFLAGLCAGSGIGDMVLPALVGIPLLTVVNSSGLARSSLRKAFILVLTLQVVFSVWAYVYGFRQFGSAATGLRASGLLGSPELIFPLMTVAVVLSFTEAKSHSSSRWFWVTIGALAGLVDIATLSRGAWICLGACLAVLSFQSRAAVPRLLLRIGAAALVFGSFWVRSGLVLVNGRTDRSTLGHLASIDVGLHELGKVWLFGGGANAYTDLASGSRQISWEFPMLLPLHIALCWGLMGFVVFYLAFLVGLSEVKEPNKLYYGAALTILLVSGLFEASLFAGVFTLPSTLALTGLCALLISDKPLGLTGTNIKLGGGGRENDKTIAA